MLLWKLRNAKVSLACDPPRTSWVTAVAGSDWEARGFPSFGVSMLKALELLREQRLKLGVYLGDLQLD